MKRNQMMKRASSLSAAAIVLAAGAAHAQVFTFSTNAPDGRMAAASRPESKGHVEIEAADDFVLTTHVRITSASFTGLLPAGTPVSAVSEVVVEIYRVFPLDSDTTRTPNVPTRNNSPSDVAFASRSSTNNELAYTESIVGAQFTAANSVQNGIHPMPNQTTGGEGAVSGEQVQFTTTFTEPFDLPAGHYFFIPQVRLSEGQPFYWLSAPKPIVAPGTPFLPDLQAWIRNGDLDPDWLRIGTDIVGGSPAPTFNMSFSLTGTYACYANCDGSTTSPFLNVNDFVCFQTEFAAGDPNANCDGSTTEPVLNVNDFVCFQYRFASGCTEP